MHFMLGCDGVGVFDQINSPPQDGLFCRRRHQPRTPVLFHTLLQPAFALRRANKNPILEQNHSANPAASAAPNVHKR
jgi:hypothetical protein